MLVKITPKNYPPNADSRLSFNVLMNKKCSKQQKSVKKTIVYYQ